MSPEELLRNLLLRPSGKRTCEEFFALCGSHQNVMENLIQIRNEWEVVGCYLNDITFKQSKGNFITSYS